MQNSADVAYKELYRYKVSHLKHGEAVLKVGHPHGEKMQILFGNDKQEKQGQRSSADGCGWIAFVLV